MFSIVLLLVSVMPSCSIVDPERLITSTNKFFSFDPNSIMESLRTNEENIFVESSLPLNERPLNNTVQWESGDYLRIAYALHKFVWGESLDGWYLRIMSFSMECSVIDDGFQDAHLTYFRFDQDSTKKSRLESKIFVIPRKSYAEVERNEYSPLRFKWSTIDINDFEISPDEALLLA
jgi:hypothetical protein